MQVKRTSPHRSKSTSAGRVDAAEGPEAPDGNELGPHSGNARGGAGGGRRTAGGRRAREAEAAEQVDATDAPVRARSARGNTPTSAADALARAQPSAPKPRRPKAGRSASAQASGAPELTLSIVEMGEALGEPGPNGREGRPHPDGKRARARRAAQAFVDDALVAGFADER